MRRHGANPDTPAFVNRVATPRLIDAAATLDASDRALVNIWMHRGLDDAVVSKLAGVTEETIAQRRARIIERLSDELGLPPEDVQAALAEITASEGHNGRPPVAAPAADQAAPPPTADETAPSPADKDRRRRFGWAALALVALTAAIVLIVIITSGSSGRGQHQTQTSRPQPTTTQSATSVSSTTTAAPPSNASRRTLAPLPGGPPHITGSVVVTRGWPHPILSLTVSGLPPASHGHYEVFLYDSLVYSEPVGRLHAPNTTVSFHVRGNANRFRSIDISFQPRGAVFDSGESVLRSANPLFGTR